MPRWLALSLLLFVTLPAAAEQVPLTFGVLNQQSPLRTAQRWNPILKYLGDAIGTPLQLRMGATVQETDAMMGRGEFDLVFTNHNFRKEYDGTYKVIARWGSKAIFGVVAVAADGPIRSPKDLAGKRIAFPSKDAFVAYAVPVAALRAAGIPFQPVFAGNQEGALAQLKAGQVDAAAVNSRYLTQYAAQQGLVYREIYTSEAYADLPVVVHPRLGQAQTEAIRKALLGMRTDPQAQPLLQAVGFDGFFAASEKDYDNVRRIYLKVAD